MTMVGIFSLKPYLKIFYIKFVQLAVMGDDETLEGQTRNAGHHLHSAHSLFPSCLCSAVIQIIGLLDDAAVSPDGNAVYEVAYQVNFLIIQFCTLHL